MAFLSLLVTTLLWVEVLPLWVGLLGIAVFAVEAIPVPPLPWHGKIGWGTVTGVFLLLGLWQWLPVYLVAGIVAAFSSYKAYLFGIRWKQRTEMADMWNKLGKGRKGRSSRDSRSG